MGRDFLAIIAEVIGVALLVAGAFWLSQRRNKELADGQLKLQSTNFELERSRMEVGFQSQIQSHQEETRQAIEASESAVKLEREHLEADRAELAERTRALESMLRDVMTRDQAILEKEANLRELQTKALASLEEISGLTQEEARARLLEQVEQEFRQEAISRGRSEFNQTDGELQTSARTKLLSVMERNATEYVTEATTTLINLPSEEMKGRLIGREGRNIRTFEQITGVDLIIDETPESVVLSCFDPVRKEIARVTLMNLVLDGRIHPGKIEEIHEQAQTEVHRTLYDAGLRAMERSKVGDLPPKVIELLGRLRFRSSYGQNVLDHSVEVSVLCSMLAAELGFNQEVSKWAGLLHDIGKGLPDDWEGPHALAGMEFLRQAGMPEKILNSVGAHHREIEPSCPEAEIVIIADKISASRPGARRESLDHYVKRLAALEQLALGFPGVDRVYAMQAGREIRVLVKPAEVDDLGAIRLSKQIAQKVESEMQYPGSIKITVIRETRHQETAK